MPDSNRQKLILTEGLKSVIVDKILMRLFLLDITFLKQLFSLEISIKLSCTIHQRNVVKWQFKIGIKQNTYGLFFILFECIVIVSLNNWLLYSISCSWNFVWREFNRIMYLIGDCDWCIGRCLSWYIDRYSTVYRSILNRVSVDTRPSVDRCIDWYIDRYSYRSIYMVVHRYFTDTLPILHRYFTDTSLILHRYFTFTECIGWYRSIY